MLQALGTIRIRFLQKKVKKKYACVPLIRLQELSANCLAALKNPAHFSLTKFLCPIGPLAELVYYWYIALVFNRKKADNS